MSQLFDTQAYKDAGFTFEEIEWINHSLSEYERTGIPYSQQEVWEHIHSLKHQRYVQNV